MTNNSNDVPAARSTEAVSCWGWVVIAATILLAPQRTVAVGTWTPLANKLTNTASAGHMMLLTDGTVMVQNNGGNNWTRLSPDIHGHYINGTWSPMASMNDARAFYASQVLTDGRVWVAGAEYGNGGTLTDAVGARAEIYNPLANTWTQVNPPASIINYSNASPVGNDNGLQAFYDCESILLPDGTVLVAPVNPNAYYGTVLFLPASNTWITGPPLAPSPQGIGSLAEATWVKLADDSILTIDTAGNNTVGTNAERYLPSLGQWVRDASVPFPLFDAHPKLLGEMGAAFLLTNGKALFLGASGQTGYYTPAGGTNAGSWSAGPNIPAGLVAADAPAAMLVNGRILCEFTPDNYHGTNYFYEFDPIGKIFTQVSSPTGGTFDNNTICDRTSMLDLPDGTLLYNDTGQQLYIYTPDATIPPLAFGKPTITSLSWNADSSLHLTGTLFNGISAGTAYGDEAQQDSNYPLVRFTDGGGNVYYGRTYNWSSTSEQTGSRIVSTECTVPPPVISGPGSYTVQVVANGISSAAVGFSGPVWVDFTYAGSPNLGTYANPYSTMAQGVSGVTSGGTILIKPGTSHETMTISKAMTISSVGGTAIIGR